ncbi:peptidoglycan DD-metalloendopeptidase family protein [Vibrio lamellibrachiae]|uniref:peptidoglycan DD-metalloendopeptidase family protein n=1 Tax=Vibrio lamellibrachiae TaxID=2910253 RepID=UPI003D13271F
MGPIVVSPPLRGVWKAINTPGDRVPSHGTHEFAQTYAYDFVKLKTRGSSISEFHNSTSFAYLLGRVKLTHCFGWGEPIYSPIEGIVTEVVNNIPERKRLHLISDLGLAIYNGLFFSFEKDPISNVGGNYLVIEGKQCCAWLAHLKYDSIKVQVGDTVTVGQIIGSLGHSGNSTAPHLHFQLMDNANLRRANGLPCSFTQYNIVDKSTKILVNNGVPSSEYSIEF